MCCTAASKSDTNLTPQTAFAYFEKSQTQFSFLLKSLCKHAGFLADLFSGEIEDQWVVCKVDVYSAITMFLIHCFVLNIFFSLLQKMSFNCWEGGRRGIKSGKLLLKFKIITLIIQAHLLLSSNSYDGTRKVSFSLLSCRRTPHNFTLKHI